MTYDKPYPRLWAGADSSGNTPTPISPTALDKIDKGILDAHAELDGRLSEEELNNTIDAMVGGYASDSRRTPSFTRLNDGNPVLTQATQNPVAGAAVAPNIYWPSIINTAAAGLVGSLDNYYLYLTTDHSVGGIYLFTAPTPIGPWTGRGKVYDDPVGPTGNGSAETATVYVDPTGATKLMMLYQIAQATGAVGTQSTIWASSNDGITWTRGAIALDITPSTPGDGHTGYAKVTVVGTAVYVHSLRGGGNIPNFGLWVSYDGGRTFSSVAMLGLGRDVIPAGRRIEWNTTSIFRQYGQLWWVGMLADYVSGSTPKDARLAVAPISEDLRHLLAPPRTILFPTQGAEVTNYRDVQLFLDVDGRGYLYYQCGNSFYVAGLDK